MKYSILLSVLLCILPISLGNDISVNSAKAEENSSLGLSWEKPIPVPAGKISKNERITTDDEVEQWEEKYIGNNYSAYHIARRFRTSYVGTSPLDVVDLEDKEGNIIKCYFDLTEYIDKYIKSKIKNQKKIESDTNREDPEGSHYTNPIILKDALTKEDVDEQQKAYVEKNYPHYKIVEGKTMTIFIHNKFENRVCLKEIDGEGTKRIIFDVNSYINEYQKTHRITLERISPVAQEVKMEQFSKSVEEKKD